MKDDFADRQQWKHWMHGPYARDDVPVVAFKSTSKVFEDQARSIAKKMYGRGSNGIWNPALAQAFHDAYNVDQLKHNYKNIVIEFDRRFLEGQQPLLECYMNESRSFLVLFSMAGVTVWHWWKTKELLKEASNLPKPYKDWD